MPRRPYRLLVSPSQRAGVQLDFGVRNSLSGWLMDIVLRKPLRSSPGGSSEFLLTSSELMLIRPQVLRAHPCRWIEGGGQTAGGAERGSSFMAAPAL
jgi:hypothetical protein